MTGVKMCNCGMFGTSHAAEQCAAARYFRRPCVGCGTSTRAGMFCEGCARHTPPPQQHYGGFRLWRLWKILESDTLYSLVAPYDWKPGTNSCPEKRSHYMDVRAGNKGFYGMKSLDDLYDEEPAAFWNSIVKAPFLGCDERERFIVGSMICHGAITVAERGATTENAIPEYMVCDVPGDRQRALSKKYKMPIISYNKAQQLKTGLVPGWYPDRHLGKGQ